MKKLDQTLFLKHFTHTGINVGVVLKRYPTAKYVGQFPLRAKLGEFSDYVADVFYEQNPKIELGHSHYFAVYVRSGDAYITDAEHVESLMLAVYEDRDGNYIYSRFQHDFRSFETADDTISIDGGWWTPVSEYEGMYSMIGRTLWNVGLPPKGKSVIISDGDFYEIEHGDTK